ncbi:pilus assembly protein [Lysobacter sp. MMG2]|uniref:pilus assembly protein n=1 Tax=Lysobacter sp. MMG2 TaxID=2801338 RepID=UPI001C21BDAE|nr:PilC/PilY family type IV pilus protein [Lysobacter sp. MMG2]MBU8976438.1 pilus assembly protein [Lysobacter sp. MMG2]
MNLERLLIVSVAAAGAAGLLVLSHVDANATRQGDGTLAQEPMHLGATVSPNFIMAIDDSGSMTFQTMFPGKDGEGCWSTSAKSFFDGTALRKSGTCDYLYVLPGPRINNYYGIPPFDIYGFARSPAYNPTYFNPDVTYDRWVKYVGDTLTDYDNASTSETLVDPRKTDKVKLFEARYEKTVGESFFIQNDMKLPAGTNYTTFKCDQWNNGNCTRWNGGVDKSYTVGATDLTWNSGAQPIAIEYTPAVVFLKENRTITGYTAAVEVKDACGTNCSLYKYVPVDAAAKQNFANWFSFYGNRNRAMVAGLTRSLKDTEKLRVGYFTINATLKDLTMRDMDTLADKKALYTEVVKLAADGSTPNRRAVAHIGNQFETNTSIIQNACQKNAGMLFTDGYSNQGGPTYTQVPDGKGGFKDTTTAYGNADSAMGTPFNDGHSSTMADIAAYFYNTRLRSGTYAAGKVPTANPTLCEGTGDKRGLDCNTNLHMNFYGITLGAKGKLFGVTYGVKADGTNNGALATKEALALTSSPAWEQRTDDNENTVDEIWHATMNARGQYINAQTPADITTAMRNVLASVGVGGGVSGSLAITGSRLGDNSLSVTPRFNRNGVDWYGDVVASKPAKQTDTDGKVTFTYTTTWTASQKVPAAADRKLFYATTDGDSTPAVADFYTSGPGTLAALCANYAANTCGPLSGADINALGVSASEAVHYLAGDRSLEGTKLRTRTTVLGDIINSTPIVAAPTDDYGYTLIRKADGGFEYDPYGYTKYLDTKKTRKRTVFVGANDGMLHAFHGDTGVEQFGYIPATSVGYMGNLLFPASPNFEHRYYVDGPVVVSDARLGTNWNTVLVGTAGAGGRSVFGLNVTSPSSFSASDVLWEVNDKMTTEAGNRIGYVLGKPVIVPVRGTDGRPVWKAIFGGGYGNRLNADGAANDGTRGTVTLFIVDMASGDVEYIDAKEDNYNLANGLGNIVAIDRYQYNSTANGYTQGSDGMVDTVYGGDLQGNVWRFDLNETGTKRVGLGGKPLFRATNGTTRQPITGGFEAAVGPRGGVMVLFGTGSFSFNNDKLNTDLQTMYGVLDMPSESITLPLTRANLQAQTMNDKFVITSTQVNYFTQRGWYLDLGVTKGDGTFTKEGERMVGYPKIEGGILYFTSYAPSGGDACTGGGSNYLYGLSTLSGGGALGIVKVGSPTATGLGEGTGRLSLATDGSAPVKDVSVFTTGKQGGLDGNPDDAAIAKYDAQGDQYCMAIVSVAGSQPLYRVRPCGRQSWRQIR